MLLAGDIGGTKTDLAIISEKAGPRRPLAEARFRSLDYPSLERLVADFLARAHYPVDRAVFGVAGPVLDGCATVTNLPWEITEKDLRQEFGLNSALLVNDLLAIAAACPLLDGVELHTLYEGRAAPGGAMAVVAPGTGLGEAYLTWGGSRYRPQPSEGGHASFAPVNAQQVALLNYVLNDYPHVSAERVCSGVGIPNIYRYLRDSGRFREPDWLLGRLAATTDVVPVIVQAATDPGTQCEICTATIGMFASILGAEAGNLALKVLATGGVFIAGGLALRVLPYLEKPEFLESFHGKGRMADLLDDIPGHVVLNPKVALLGAAQLGLDISLE